VFRTSDDCGVFSRVHVGMCCLYVSVMCEFDRLRSANSPRPAGHYMLTVLIFSESPLFPYLPRMRMFRFKNHVLLKRRPLHIPSWFFEHLWISSPVHHVRQDMTTSRDLQYNAIIIINTKAGLTFLFWFCRKRNGCNHRRIPGGQLCIAALWFLQF